MKPISLLKVVTIFITLNFSALCFSYTIHDYVKTLNQNNVTEIDDAISLLPLSLRTYFSIVHTGNGLRGTSPLEPAIISFAPDGSFFVNVGSKNQAEGNVIEILQFNKDKRNIELYSLSFPLKKNSKGLIPIPKVNPPRCLKCHGEKPNALWGNYNQWHGFYGNRHDDRLRNDNIDNFIKFKEVAKNTSPYMYFNFDESNPTSPFQSYSKPSFQITNRPNTHGGYLVSRINAIKMAKQIESSPLYERNKVEIIEALMCINSFDLYKAEDLLKRVGLSEIDIQQLQQDGSNTTNGLIGFDLYSRLNNSDKLKIKREIKSTTFLRYVTGIITKSKHDQKHSLLPKAADYKLYHLIDKILSIPDLSNSNYHGCTMPWVNSISLDY